jgi:hypothetical protein
MENTEITAADTDVTTNINDTSKSGSSFIVANTIGSNMYEVREKHIIPVFVKDNEPLISHAEFIENVMEVVKNVFRGELICQPIVRVSHPIKGRVPEAKDKPAHLLQDWEKTLYYERMAFIIEIPSIQDAVGGNLLSLTIGGVKSYSQDNLYNRKGADQHFKIFVGFQNKVCTNLCVWTDGLQNDLRVTNARQLQSGVSLLLEGYNAKHHLDAMQGLVEIDLTEKQFALLIGRCRMYQHVPPDVRSQIPSLEFGDAQINALVKDYYRDKSFCRDPNGRINLWKVYNLFTGANKSSYADSFLSRSASAFDLVSNIRRSLQDGTTCWYLN